MIATVIVTARAVIVAVRAVTAVTAIVIVTITAVAARAVIATVIVAARAVTAIVIVTVRAVTATVIVAARAVIGADPLEVWVAVLVWVAMTEQQGPLVRIRMSGTGSVKTVSDEVVVVVAVVMGNVTVMIAILAMVIGGEMNFTVVYNVLVVVVLVCLGQNTENIKTIKYDICLRILNLISLLFGKVMLNLLHL